LPPFKSLYPPRGTDAAIFVLSAIASLGGIYAAYLMFLKKPVDRETLDDSAVRRFLSSGWGFDSVYDSLMVRPAVRLARLNVNDVLDLVYKGIAWVIILMHSILRLTQTGSLRWYAMGVVFGAIIFIGLVILL
jgi:NADH-quinone oxidoreductase subunit L